MMKQPELGQKILELRNIKRWTQEELVERCNLNVRTLQRIESGKVTPRSYTTKIIFEVLEYDLTDTYSNKGGLIKVYFEKNIKLINEKAKKIELMKNSNNFFYNYFLSIGVVWFLCVITMPIFEIHFQEKEILLTIIIPLAFTIFRHLKKRKFHKSIS